MGTPDRILLERIALFFLCIASFAVAGWLTSIGERGYAEGVGAVGVYLMGYLRQRRGDIDTTLPRSGA